MATIYVTIYIYSSPTNPTTTNFMSDVSFRVSLWIVCCINVDVREALVGKKMHIFCFKCEIYQIMVVPHYLIYVFRRLVPNVGKKLLSFRLGTIDVTGPTWIFTLTQCHFLFIPFLFFFFFFLLLDR